MTYGPLCARFYDYDKPAPPPTELAMYRALAVGGAAIGPTLELMCGSGRFLTALAREPVEVVGIDASAAMLERCRARLGEASHIELRLEPACELADTQRYGLVVCPAGSLDLIVDGEELRETLRRVRRSLKPGGRFVFDGSSRRPTKDWDGPWGGRWADAPDGSERIVLSWLSRYRATTGVVEAVHRYERVVNGRVLDSEVESFRLRHFEASERIEQLRDAGFVTVRTHAAHSLGSAPATDADEVVYEALV